MGRAAPIGNRRLGRALAATLAMIVALLFVGCGGETTSQANYADRVVVKKSERKMQLLNRGKVLREYRIALGDNPRGHKMREGDESTPVGDYLLDWRNPRSNYYKSIHVSYPNERDRALAKLLGVDPGGMIMVHGMPNHIRSETVRAEYRRRDWTNGCIAVQDHEMDEIWRLVRDGTPIRIQE
ncbi:L,D-transpeptidase family protein [uncultured Lamprocystis sp.]|uniref:L,D-transpeptidase family protein n=1 Tax=uncultured Lamprocystis sp. TaxID=543132 RepID=UPI0025D5ECDF|nr:L,D-transpeptidase family protein [uncultured Lamprocystis sp.]